MTLRSAALPLFAVATIGVYAAALAVAARLSAAPDPTLLAAALAADVVVLVPLLYYGLVVWGRGASPITLAPVVALSLVGAYAVLPEAHEGVLGWFGIGVVLVEAAALTWVGLRARIVVRAYRRSTEADLLAKVRGALAAAVGPGLVTEALATEAVVPLYALGRGREPRDEDAFGYRARSGYVATCSAIGLVALVELGLGHFLLLRYVGETAALTHLALSLYGGLWLIADLRAMRARPIRLSADRLLIRCGLRWTAEVPVSQIVEVRRLTKGSYSGTAGFCDLTPLGEARYAVVLTEPVTARGPFGITRSATRLGLDVDDRERFEAQLAAIVGAA
ncbi:MAG: hypothetical protein AAF791_03015 [Bacteroidota bacterium]